MLYSTNQNKNFRNINFLKTNTNQISLPLYQKVWVTGVYQKDYSNEATCYQYIKQFDQYHPFEEAKNHLNKYEDSYYNYDRVREKLKFLFYFNQIGEYQFYIEVKNNNNNINISVNCDQQLLRTETFEYKQNVTHKGKIFYFYNNTVSKKTFDFNFTTYLYRSEYWYDENGEHYNEVKLTEFFCDFELYYKTPNMNIFNKLQKYNLLLNYNQIKKLL